MITLKDMIDLNPRCNVVIHNGRGCDFVDMYKNPEEYIISDMYTYNSRLEILVNKKDEFELKFNKHGDVCVDLGMDKLFADDNEDDDE